MYCLYNFSKYDTDFKPAVYLLKNKIRNKKKDKNTDMEYSGGMIKQKWNEKHPQ